MKNILFSVLSLSALGESAYAQLLTVDWVAAQTAAGFMTTDPAGNSYTIFLNVTADPTDTPTTINATSTGTLGAVQGSVDFEIFIEDAAGMASSADFSGTFSNFNGPTETATVSSPPTFNPLHANHTFVGNVFSGVSGGSPVDSSPYTLTIEDTWTVEMDISGGSGTTWRVDRASFQTIPEPSSSFLLGFGGLGLLARRRRA